MTLAGFGESILLFYVFSRWSMTWVVCVLTGHLALIFSLARPLLSASHRLYRFQAHPLDRWRRFSRADLAELRTLTGVVRLSECELGRPFSQVVFCSDATLRRYCVQCTTSTFEELKDSTRFRERWRFRARETSHTLPVRHANEVARLGALTPLGGHSRDDLEEQDNSGPVVSFGRTADFEEVSTRYGAWLDSQGLHTRGTALRASSPEAMEVVECVGAIRRLSIACWPSIRVAHADTIYSVCVAVQLLCVSAPTCRGSFDTWRPGVILRTKGLDEPLVLVARGLCGALLSHLRLNMFLELWVFRFVSTLRRQIP